MDTLAPGAAAQTAPVYVVHAPAEQTIPIVFCSPHSGTDYNEAFRKAARLDFATLRKSEDSHVDLLYGDAPAKGAPLLCALFPRAFVDPNREPFELDQTMFEERLPDYVNTASPRVAAGLGTIAKVVCNGAEIYRKKLRFAEAVERIDTYYRPYHAALTQLLEDTKHRFGLAMLVDCHSMPSVGGPMDRDPGSRRVDFVLGDAYGAACHPALTLAAEAKLRDFGYAVHRNMPYAGGYTTRHYGNPAQGQHALQIEINRALYMDEDTYGRRPAFDTVRAHLSALIDHLAALDLGALTR
ncbi:MAG: N-formylglutamate amidohydrolase [Rhodospirillaceae bacterium]|nr:N-formylglutamate amidohydrolase [Rhodospirillaceae bacterium]